MAISPVIGSYNPNGIITAAIGERFIDLVDNNEYEQKNMPVGSNWQLVEKTINPRLKDGTGTAVWGGITGTLSDQTDLQTALNNKQPVGDYITGLSGDGSATGPGLAVFTLDTVNLSPGTYTNATINVDGKGRVISASSGASHNAVTIGTPANGLSITGGQVLSVAIASATQIGVVATADYISWTAKQPAGNYITALTGDVTASGPGSAVATLATVNSNIGTFNNVTVNAKGLITAASNVAYLIANQTITLSGDASGSGNTAITVTLATVNSNVGSFGSASSVATFTVNGKGLVTAASNTAIQITESQVTNLVTDLAGKEPTIAAGTTLQYWRGDKSWQTLNTSVVPEVTNLYFTTARVLATALTGYTVGANTAIAATDTILAAFGKVQGQINAKENALTFSTGLTRATNTITANLATGISGGQSAIGGTGSGDNLTLSSTTNGTKGKILFGTSAYDEVNNRLGVAMTSPTFALDVTGDIRSSTGNYYTQATVTTVLYAGLNKISFGSTTGGTLLICNDISGAKWAIGTGGYDLTFYKERSTDSTWQTAVIFRGTAAANRSQGCGFFVNGSEVFTINSSGNTSTTGTLTTPNLITATITAPSFLGVTGNQTGLSGLSILNTNSTAGNGVYSQVAGSVGVNWFGAGLLPNVVGISLNSTAGAYVGNRSNGGLFLGTNDLARVSIAAAGDVTVNTGNLGVATLGKGLSLKAGANGRAVTGTLVAGALLINNTTVTANTYFIITDIGGGVLANIGALFVDAALTVAGVSFTVKSTNPIDTSNFTVILIETT